MIQRTILLIILSSLFLRSGQAQPTGNYSGHIRVMGQEINIKASFSEVNGSYNGQLSVPAQGAQNLKMNSIRYEKPDISFRVDTVTSHLEFEGEYFAGGDSLSGTFRQSGYEGSFLLTAAKEKEEQEQVPWVRQEVTFKNDTIQLAGTLSLPDTTKKYPAVMLISGSGQQTRDENVMGFKIFRNLEEHLVQQDLAVLRYDDRGAGASDHGNVEQATSKDLAGDALAGYRFLQDHPHIYKKKIGMLGHSEGSIIANMVASRTDVAFVVMMAGPVMPGHELLIQQGEAIMIAENEKPEKIRKNLETNQMIYQQVMKENTDWEKVHRLLNQALADQDSTQKIQIIDQQMAFLKKPWMEFFLKYDPAKEIARSEHPILAAFGGKDTQVPAKANQRKLKKLQKNHNRKNIEVIIFDQANHLFQKAQTGSPSEYGKLDKAFIEGFPEKAGAWIHQQVDRNQ